jgi:hypothetical protein
MSDQRSGASAGEGESRLLNLAKRLLASEDPVAREVQWPKIFVGRLPEEMPIDIPIPEGLEVVGSLLRDERNPYDDPSVEIVLDAGMPAERVRDAYRELMTAAGWSEPDQRGFGGGFGFRPIGVTALFCRGERGPALYLSARDTAANDRGAPTDVRLRLVMGSRYSPCAPEPYHEPDFERMIPNLAPPPGAYQYPGGGGGSTDDVHATATLETDLEPAAVGVHYANQLEGAGWTRTDESRGGKQAWSTWRFADEDGSPWSALFFALQLPEAPRRFFLLVHAVQTPEWRG